MGAIWASLGHFSPHSGLIQPHFDVFRTFPDLEFSALAVQIQPGSQESSQEAWNPVCEASEASLEACLASLGA